MARRCVLHAGILVEGLSDSQIVVTMEHGVLKNTPVVIPDGPASRAVCPNKIISTVPIGYLPPPPPPTVYTVSSGDLSSGTPSSATLGSSDTDSSLSSAKH